MHLTLSSGDAMKLLLDGYIPPDIEYNLITMSTFYITQKGKKVNQKKQSASRKSSQTAG
jgi:hypothetical protein